jgi:hypothetical protein
MEGEEQEHQAAIASLQELLRRSLANEASLDSRLKILLSTAREDCVCKGWKREENEDEKDSLGGANGLGDCQRKLHGTSGETKALERELSVRNDMLQSAAEQNVVLSNQVDLLKCVAEEALEAAGSFYHEKFFESEKRISSDALNTVEEQLLSLQSLLESPQPHMKQKLPEDEVEMAQEEKDEMPGKHPMAHQLKAAQAELLLLREMVAAKDHEIETLSAQLAHANKLLVHMCHVAQTDSESCLLSREGWDNEPQADTPHMIYACKLQRAQAQKAALWHEVCRLSADNETLVHAARRHYTSEVLANMHLLYTCKRKSKHDVAHPQGSAASSSNKPRSVLCCSGPLFRDIANRDITCAIPLAEMMMTAVIEVLMTFMSDELNGVEEK